MTRLEFIKVAAASVASLAVTGHVALMHRCAEATPAACKQA